jgi:hypothetical protein
VDWVLAGCGWGAVVGGALEAAFGRGVRDLPGAAGETSLEAAAGGLAGMTAGAVLMTALLVGTLVPVAAVLDALQKGFTSQGRPGLRHESSTGRAAWMGLVAGMSVGTALGALVGAAFLLDRIQGRPFSFAFVQVGTRLGAFAGGIAGAAELGRSIWQQTPEVWRRFSYGPRPTK